MTKAPRNIDTIMNVIDLTLTIGGKYIFQKYSNEDGTFYTRGENCNGGIDVFHRTDGPAIIRKNGKEEYWLVGQQWKKQDFDKIDSWIFNKFY